MRILTVLMKILESDVGVTIRAATIFFFCFVSWFTILGSSQTLENYNDKRIQELEGSIGTDRVLTEKRFSILETKMDSVKDSQSNTETYRWIELIMLSGLLGERGLQLAKNKRSNNQ